MITEKAFVLGHAAFWHELLPTERQYVSLVNGACHHYLPPYDGASASDSNRGVINELAFRICYESNRRKVSVREIEEATRLALELDALLLLGQMRHLSRVGPGRLDDHGREEAVDIAERMRIWLDGTDSVPLFQPRFRGCGWLDTCHGDLLASTSLVEFKAGDRGLRAIDVRQALSYCALNFASKDFDIDELIFVNPRTGKNFTASIEDLCRGCAGRSAGAVLARIVDYISTPIAGFMSE